jgi:hypothetical protein
MRGLIGFLAVVLFGSGCTNAADDCRNTRTCDPPPDAGTTVIYVVSDAGVQCDGVCAPLPSAGNDWSPQPFLLWIGLPEQLPKQLCPKNASVNSSPWYANPDQAMTCPTCSCAPSTGVCVLPETVSVSPSPECPSDASDAGVPFDPPDAWDGGCTTNDAIAAVECDGGACAATVGPMLPIDECMPFQAVIPKLVTWGLAAYTCTGTTNGGACVGSGEVCTPTPPDGFEICVSRHGDDPVIPCPGGYPQRYVVYVGSDDNRECAPCGCEPPQGSTCSSLVSLYADDACSMQVASVTATSSDAMCVDIPAGSPLGSKHAGPVTYTPGTCQPSGGQVTGTVQPQDPVTFCCEK